MPRLRFQQGSPGIAGDIDIQGKPGLMFAGIQRGRHIPVLGDGLLLLLPGAVAAADQEGYAKLLLHCLRERLIILLHGLVHEDAGGVIVDQPGLKVLRDMISAVDEH